MFIHAKDQGDLTNFNISVGVTDAFMQAVETMATSNWRTGPSPPPTSRRRRLPARGRQLGVPQGAGARPVGPDHALHLRPRRAGHPVPRPHEQGQQPLLLRDHRGHQPLRRTAAAALRLLLPGLDQPHPASSSMPSPPKAELRLRRLRPRCVELSTRMLDNVLDATHWPLEQQQKEATTSAASASASPAWAMR
jgi:ribonucleoside-diphosphate reductase alpha chain